MTEETRTVIFDDPLNEAETAAYKSIMEKLKSKKKPPVIGHPVRTAKTRAKTKAQKESRKRNRK